VPWAGNFVRNFQPNLTVFITPVNWFHFSAGVNGILLHLQGNRNFKVVAIVEVIRSGLKFSIALRSRGGRMSKTVQPCGWFLVSADCNGA